jgi:hypothetical protein
LDVFSQHRIYSSRIDRSALIAGNLFHPNGQFSDTVKTYRFSSLNRSAQVWSQWTGCQKPGRIHCAG